MHDKSAGATTTWCVPIAILLAATTFACEPGGTVRGLTAAQAETLTQSGRQGTLVGLDYTGAMLERARERIAREGWKNVELIQGDAAQIDFDQTFDAALCTLAIGVIPDYRGPLENMVKQVKEGGKLALGDAKRSSFWSGRPFNWFADLLGYGAAEDVSRRPWESLREIVGDFRYEEWCSGFFYVASGRRQA